MLLRLRQEIVQDGAALRDPVTAAVHSLDQLDHVMIDTLAVPMEVEDLIAAVAQKRQVGRHAIERRLRQLMLMGLLEHSCSDSREKLRRIRGGEELAARVLEGSRFGCQNAGACCRGYVFGPIGEQEKTRIEALVPRGALPQLGDQPLFIETGAGSGKPTYRLGTRGDACVFLEAGPRCGLHRAFGAAAKPALCQLYPLAAVATVEGLKIYDRGECASFAVSARTGPRLEEDVSRIRALVKEDIYHPVVTAHGSWRCDYGLILKLSRRLDEELKTQPPLMALHSMGHLVRGFIAALTRCPIDAGQPEATVSAVLESSAEAFRPPDAAVAKNAQAGLRAMAILAEGLRERVAPHEPLAPLFMEAAAHVAEVCRHAAGAGSLSERARAAAAISMDGDCEGAIRLSLRQTVFGRELLLDDQLPAGLLRMAFMAVLTLAGARLRALAERRDRMLAPHLSAGHTTAMRTLRRPEPHGLLRANGEQAWPILDALPLLARELGARRVASVE